MNDELKKQDHGTDRGQRGGKRLSQTASAREKRTQRPRRAQGETAAAVKEPIEKRERPARTERPASGRKRSGVSGWLALMGAKFRRSQRRWKHIVREKKARRFPESERLPIQMVLFAWGMLPTLMSRLREITWGRRKRAINRFGRTRSWLERQRVRPVAFLGITGVLAAVVLFCSFYTVGTTVTYDGKVLGAVSSESDVENVRNDLEVLTAKTLGTTWTIDDSLLQYDSGLMRRQEVGEAEILEAELSEEIGLITNAYCLYVDGEFIGAIPYEGALEELLQQLQYSVTNAETISCSFSENVEIKEEHVATDKIMNLGYLAEILYSTKEAEVNYEVKKGDTWSEIAEAHGMTNKELLALNPGYDIDKLQIGEVLTMSAAVPYLTLTVQQREHYVEDVAFDIIYTDNPNLYKGDYKVTSPGTYGAADVVANVTYVNGEEIQRTVLSSVTLKAPVTEYRDQGTKERPTWHPTGSFRWPCSGRVTSYFGGRKSPGGIGSTNHKGIDIAGYRGSPIYAADGGTVTYAGWMGGYGYMVQINHGNGYVTYYAHNSKLLVSVGQHVYKGQQIAKMGSTGNSTGNHCHFEIRYNGTPRNPLNFI